MKKFLYALMFFTTFNSLAQNSVTDSLKRLLRKEIADTIRVMLLNNLAYQYCYSSPDTSLVLTQQSLALARQAGFVKGEAIAVYSLGTIAQITGNYPKFLECYIQALKKFDSLQNLDGITGTFVGFGNTYSELGDQQMAINYYRKSKALAEAIPNTQLLNYILIGLGDIYEKLNQLDSARIYTNQGYELAVRLNNAAFRYTALLNLGNIHSRMQQDYIAMGYYRQSFSLEKALKALEA